MNVNEKRRGFVIALLIASVCSPLLAQQTSNKSDREKAGLVGPVSKITIEVTTFGLRIYEWRESERYLLIENEYDRDGKLIKTKSGNLPGSAITDREKYSFDDKGRVKEKYAMDGCRKKILESYAYDDKDRKIAIYVMDGSKKKILDKYTYEEDSHGNWTKKVHLRANSEGDDFHPVGIEYRTIVYFD